MDHFFFTFEASVSASSRLSSEFDFWPFLAESSVCLINRAASLSMYSS